MNIQVELCYFVYFSGCCQTWQQVWVHEIWTSWINGGRGIWLIWLYKLAFWYRILKLNSKMPWSIQEPFPSSESTPKTGSFAVNEISIWSSFKIYNMRSKGLAVINHLSWFFLIAISIVKCCPCFKKKKCLIFFDCFVHSVAWTEMQEPEHTYSFFFFVLSVSCSLCFEAYKALKTEVCGIAVNFK